MATLPQHDNYISRAGKNEFPSWEHNLEIKIFCGPTEYFCAKSACV
jgi:hypothetical protein